MKFTKKLDVAVFQRIRALRLFFARERFCNSIEIDRAPAAPRHKDDLILFTSGDGPYLQRFLHAFVRSVVEHVAEPRVHVHLFNPTKNEFALLEDVAHNNATLALSWSRETFSCEEYERRARASPKQSWRSLYICCARFLAARAIQQRSGSPLLMTDIDVLIHGDVRARFGGDIGVSLLLRPQQPYLSKRTLGGVVFVSNTPEAHAFLSTTCDYIERFLAAGLYWFAFDQYALYKGLGSLSAEQTTAHFSPLTARDIDFDLTADALIASPKGRLKYSEKFAQLARSELRDSEVC